MDQTYTIISVGVPRPWQHSSGQAMLTYDLTLGGVPQIIELNQRTNTPAPQPNTQITGEIYEQNGYWKFKKADTRQQQPQQQAMPQAAPQPVPHAQPPQPVGAPPAPASDDPVQRLIVMQHAQKVGAEIAIAMAQHGTITPEQIFLRTKGMAEELCAHVFAQAKHGQHEPAGPPSNGHPPDQSDFAAVPPQAEEPVPF